MRNNIGLFLAKRAELSPTLEAFIEIGHKQRRFNYTELNLRSNRIANALLERGVKKGDRVALLMMNSPEYMETFFALAKIGAVAVPLNWRLVPDELSFILKDSGAHTLVYGQDFAPSAEDLHGRGPDVIDIRQWICLEGGEKKAAFALDYDEITTAASDEEPEISSGDDDNLYIMYTSGTTGLPKGAVHTHNTAMWASLTINLTADVRYGDRYVVALPLFHVGALTPLTGNVHSGVTNIVMRAFGPSETWRLIEHEKVTVMLAVPAMLNFMLQVPEIKECDYSSLRWIMSGAAPVPVSLIEAYDKMNIEVVQVYGLTETCGPACLINPEDAIRKAGSTGKAFFHTDVDVVNTDGKSVTPDEVGEVIVRGAHIMTKYWNRPDATEEAIRDGWLYTGDLASRDEDGFIFIQDRKKDMIISGGENIYPAEIENVILSHPGVKEVAVIGQTSEKWGEIPLAIVVKSDNGLDEDNIIEHCMGRMAKFKMPKHVQFIDEIPRNPTGKILKRILREQFPDPAPE